MLELAAADALYDDLRDFTKRFTYSRVKNNFDAEDVMQNAWIRVLTHFQQFRGDGKFSSWLASIILNECRAIHKRSKRSRTVSLDHELHFGMVFGSNAEAQIQRGQLVEEVRRNMHLLPTIYRTVLVMRYVRDLSLKQIAEELQITEIAAKSRLYRARTQLAARLVGNKRRDWFETRPSHRIQARREARVETARGSRKATLPN